MARWAGRLAISGATLGVTLRPLILNSWEPWTSAAWVVGLLLVAVAFWANLDALADRLPGPSTPLVLAVVAGMGAGALFISGSFTLGGLGMALTGAIGPLAIWGLIAPPLATRRGIAAAVAPLYVALLANGLFYAELPKGVAALLLASPLLAWVGMAAPLRKLGPRARACIVAVVVALPAGAALAWAFAASPPLEGEGRIREDRPALVDWDLPGRGDARGADGCAS